MPARKRKHEKGLRAFAGKLWESRLTWLLIGFFMGYFLDFYLNPIIFPALSEKPELKIQVLHSHAPYTDGQIVYNITWNSRYIEYVVMIQQDMAKAKSTPIVDVHIAFDFNRSVVAIHEEEIVGTSELSIKVPFITTIGMPDARSLQVIFEAEELRPAGFCSFAVVIDPYFQSSTYRSEAGGENAYFGHYYYSARGIIVKRAASGTIPID